MSSYASPHLDHISLPLTNGYLVKVIDEKIPQNLLDFVLNKVNHYINNIPASAEFQGDPSLISNSKSVKTDYKQWYLQKDDAIDDWEDSDFYILNDYLHTWFEGICEFKFSMTSPETELSWHIMHPKPRVHIPLSDNNCLFDIVDSSQKMHTFELERGKLYLLNVCYPHRVRNLSTDIRKQAFFCYQKLKPTV
jgi:hypothetical protein